MTTTPEERVRASRRIAEYFDRQALFVLPSAQVAQLLSGKLSIRWPEAWRALRFDWSHERDALVIIVNDMTFPEVAPGVQPPTLMTRQDVTDAGVVVVTFDAYA